MTERVARTADRTPPRAGVKDDHEALGQSAYAIAATLSDVIFGRRLTQLDMQTWREVCELASDTVARAIEEHVPAEPSPEPDPLEAHRDREGF